MSSPPRSPTLTERFCFLFHLKAGREAEYQKRHREIWPEMADAIKAAGISNYTLFRRGRQIIAYCECSPDAATAFGRLGETEVSARWSAWFEDVIESLVDEHGRLRDADEVWHLD